jgi:hypothetical protein
MACKRSGVQIPSAPPQVNAPVRLEAPPNPPPRAADRQQAALLDLLRPPKVAVTLRRSPVPSPHRALSSAAPPRAREAPSGRPLGLLMQLRGCGDGPLLSVGNCCGPLLRARPGATAGEGGVDPRAAAMVTSSTGGEAVLGDPVSSAGARRARSRSRLVADAFGTPPDVEWASSLRSKAWRWRTASAGVAPKAPGDRSNVLLRRRATPAVVGP